MTIALIHIIGKNKMEIRLIVMIDIGLSEEGLIGLGIETIGVQLTYMSDLVRIGCRLIEERLM